MGQNWFDDLYEDLFDDGRDDEKSTLVDDRLGGVTDLEEHVNLIPWWNAGFEDHEAMAWVACGFTVREAEAAVAAGITVDRAYDWLTIGYSELPVDEPSDIRPHPDQIPLAEVPAPPIESMATGPTFADVVGDDLDTLFPTLPTVKRTRRTRRRVDDSQLSLLDFSEDSAVPSTDDCEAAEDGVGSDQLSLFASD